MKTHIYEMSFPRDKYKDILEERYLPNIAEHLYKLKLCVIGNEIYPHLSGYCSEWKNKWIAEVTRYVNGLVIFLKNNTTKSGSKEKVLKEAVTDFPAFMDETKILASAVTDHKKFDDVEYEITKWYNNNVERLQEWIYEIQTFILDLNWKEIGANEIKNIVNRFMEGWLYV